MNRHFGLSALSTKPATKRAQTTPPRVSRTSYSIPTGKEDTPLFLTSVKDSGDSILIGSVEYPVPGACQVAHAGCSPDWTKSLSGSWSNSWSDSSSSSLPKSLTNGWTESLSSSLPKSLTNSWSGSLTSGWSENLTDSWTENLTNGWTESLTNSWLNGLSNSLPRGPGDAVAAWRGRWISGSDEVGSQNAEGRMQR